MQNNKKLIMFIVSLTLFMDILDTNIINTAIPAIANSLLVNPIDVKVALISYLLSIAVFIPISGWASDKYGIRPIYLVAIILFTISSFWCGYVSTLTELVFARLIQGVGGAFMLSMGRLSIARAFERHELVDAMNKVILVVSVAVMIGPFLGGLITDHLSWPWIFWINIPIGIFCFALIYRGVHDTTQLYSHPFDLGGFILFGGSLSLLLFALSMLSEQHTRIDINIAIILIAALLLLLYFRISLKKAHPIVDVKLFRAKTLRISVLGNITSRIGFGGVPFLLPLLQQIGLGYSAQLSGLLMVPIAFGIITSKLIVLPILRKLGYRHYLIGNTMMVSIVIYFFSFINTNTSYIDIILLTFMFGLFISAQFTAMNSLAYAEIPKSETSKLTTITSTVQVLSQSLGVASAALLLRLYSPSWVDSSHLTPAIFHRAFISLSLFTGFTIIVYLYLSKTDGKEMLAK